MGEASNVYFIPLAGEASETELSGAGRRILAALLERESVTLAPEVPLKVHFGEKGNRTYLKPGTYNGIIGLLREKGVSSAFMETSVLYGGERFRREKHLKLAADHGFDQLPVIIADGANGEEAREIPIALKHFRSASIAAALADAPQVLVAAHFKGHMLAGFGGAIKQLSMGFAAKGGKMAMHMSVKPRIRRWMCKGCGLCVRRCQNGALRMDGGKARINAARCVGCGACFSICPHHGVSIFSLAGLWNALMGGRPFREKLVEYAYASAHGKPHIYVTFAVNITRGCDCEPLPMKRTIPDIGVFASMDPVAIDSACLDAAAKLGKKFRGREQLEYAEKIGLGSRDYRIVTL